MQGFSFVGHVEELRKRVIYVLIFFFVALVGSIFFVQRIYDFLAIPVQGRLTVLGPGDVVQIYLMIAGVTALTATTPFLLFQLWRFVQPGLLPREKRYALQLIGPVTIMFLLGISFSYFLIFPQIFHFLKLLAQSNFHFMVTATEYFSFMFGIVVPFGFLFELPIVVLFLTHIGLITPAGMRKNRRYAYFACVLLGVFISPPELISHLSVVAPMVLVYEISIGISSLAYKRRLAEEAEWGLNEKSADGPGQVTVELGGVDELADDDGGRTPQVPLETDDSAPELADSAEMTDLPETSKFPRVSSKGLRAFSQPAEPLLPQRPGIGVEERE